MKWLKVSSEEWIAFANNKEPVRIRQSGRNADGTYSYFCYRNGKAIAVTRDFTKAQMACMRGKTNVDNVKR